MWVVIAVFLAGMAPAIAVGRTIYVDADASTGGDGQTWGTAYKYLQDALYEPPTGGDEIWVAEGTYKPDQGGGKTPGDRYATFQLKNNVVIKGGFAGFGEPDPNDMDLSAYETILSGDLNGDDGPNFANNGENSYHVVVGSGTDITAVLEGFIITGGNADNGYPHNRGGGIQNYSGSPTLINCTISGNFASQNGGGMKNRNGSSPTLINCSFSDNVGIDGGGIFNYYDSALTLINCIFTGNSAWAGGGIESSGNMTLTNCAFTGNSGWGSGISYFGNGNMMLTNCIFNANLGSGMAGYGYILLTNCTFTGNGSGIQSFEEDEYGGKDADQLHPLGQWRRRRICADFLGYRIPHRQLQLYPEFNRRVRWNWQH